MKNLLRTAVLVTMFHCTNIAYAGDASSALQIADMVFSKATSASTEAMKEITQAMADVQKKFTEWQKDFEQTEWFKQATKMKEQLDKAHEAMTTLTSQITGFTSAVTGFTTKVQARNIAFPQEAVNYKYAQSLPDTLMTEATCKDDKPCEITDPGYKSISANISSIELRDSLKVKANEVGGSFSFFGTSIGTGKSIAQISREAAELNAQELAVIDTMAREAYLQASNRVAAINDLQDALLNPPAGEANTLKYTTDVQAMIVAEQAFLINDQNRIAALAVLQQSQRDRYEQRKKEIVEFVNYGDRSVKTGTFDPTDPTTYLSDSTYQGLKRVAIAGTTQAAFSALQAQYK